MTCLPSPSRNLAMPDPTANSLFDRATKPLNVIRCPVCRQECMEVDVMENFFVKDSWEIPSSVQRTVQICMSCEDNTEASAFCVDCVEFLCYTCVEAHQRVKFTKDHTIRQKEEVAEEARGVSNQRPAFCDIHKQEPLKLFCETCDLLTCRDCQLLKHKDHNYQFLEDAYKNLKRHMETVTNQLQEKKKVVDEMSSSIDKGLSQVDENRTLVHNEIKKAICSLILEINRKGKILVNQLEALTKDSETVLKKQKEDIGYLSRHLDHVINFTQWATARNSSTALLHCKRLILFQIGNLLRAKCNTSFAPQSTLRFQCRSGFWASNVDLGSLVVENLPSHSLGVGYQGLHQQLPLPRQGPQGSPSGPPPGPPQAHPAPHSTLAQLQLQVEKLAQQPHWQPPPPPWSWYQSLGLQKPAQGPLHVGSPSQTGLPMPQPGRRFMPPPSNHLSPTGSLPSPGFAPQAVLPLKGMTGSSGYQPPDPFQLSPLHSHSAPLLSNSSFSSPHSHLQTESLYLSQRTHGVGPVQIRRPSFSQTLPPFLPHRNAEGLQSSQGLPAVSREEKPGIVSWRPAETQSSAAQTSAAKRRRRLSPGPIIVIKDEPEEDMSYMQAYQKASLPDSTGVQAPPHHTGEHIQTHPNPPHHTGEHIQTHPNPPHHTGEHIQTHPNPPHHTGEHIQTHPNPPHHAGEHIQTHPNPPHHTGEHIQTHPNPPHHTGEHILTHPNPPHHTGEHIQTHPNPPHHAGKHIQTHPNPPHHTGEHIQTHPNPPHHTGEHILTHPNPPHHTGEHIQTHPNPPHHAGEHIQTHPNPPLHTGEHILTHPNLPHHAGEHIQTHPNPSLDDQAKTPPQPPKIGDGPAQPDGPQQTAVAPDLAPEKDPNRDRCAVCQTEGKLWSCDKCPKVFHLTCHIPSLPTSPSTEWLCTFCREPSLPEMEDGRVRQPEPVKEEPLSEPRLSPVNRTKCERLLLCLYCSELSARFQETPLVMPEDTGAVKAHMNLATVKNRLESPSSPDYHSPAQFVSDVRLIFRNPAAHQEPGSEVATAARKLERLFEEQLKVVYPDRTFPEVKTEVTGPVTPPVSPPSTPGLAPAAEPLSRCSEPRGAASPISTTREEREAA
ncbi:transcription intermediary factor 1-alpha-like [Hypomesus transpacificus]|uniref:transcription intermediary factor 1-alpha-like n=1 Tax=Hypomesus transpacificus TaxID=137520 RepID=UPI001F07AEDA|nr:transcription intermediary factor 1-alpha-like [Hypomesus transpacificus]